MKRTVLIACAFMPALLLSAQLKNLSIEDASYRNRALFGDYPNNLTWRNGTDHYTYVDKNSLILGEASDRAVDTLLTLSDINRELGTLERSEMRRFPAIKWLDENRFMFTHDNTVFSYLMDEGYLKEENRYDEGAENISVDPVHFNVAYTIDNNLYVATRAKQLQVTNDEEPGILNGHTVHRVEFGIDKGVFWSPGGNLLAFYRKDEKMVEDYPLVDIDQRTAKPNNIKYPMAGGVSEEVTLGIYDPGSGKTVFLETGEPADQYITSVTWGPDEKFIYAGILNRDQNHLKVNQYDVLTGHFIKTLFEEKHDIYVEPEHVLYFLNGDPTRFIWFSERDGYQHLYLYNTEGELIRQLTEGDWVVTDFYGTDAANKKAFFACTKESPLNRDLFSVELKNGKIRPLSSKAGTHRMILNDKGTMFIDIFRDTVTMAAYSIGTTSGKDLGTIFEAEDPLRDYELGQVSVFRIMGEDSTELYCRMILPPGFDPSVKYPVINYVYGGPHAQLITNTPRGGASLFLDYLAQEGFIIFTLDNRGSANRGRDFEQAVFRNLGEKEVKDQMTGIEYLESLPFVDRERIGVHGWSYGGFMTISLMLRHPETFKTGVCGGPVTDWKYYEVMYGERYMDTPETNPEGYENSSLLNRAGNLKGDLLIIHGTHDPVVVWQHTLALLDRFIKEGVEVDYFVYPGHGHGVGGKDRVHLNRKMARFFKEHL